MKLKFVVFWVGANQTTGQKTYISFQNNSIKAEIHLRKDTLGA